MRLLADQVAGRRNARRARLRGALTVLGLLTLVAVLSAGCIGAPGPGAAPTAPPGASPGVSPVPSPTPAPTPLPTPLLAAQPGADPVSLLAWLFTPIFQALFILLTGLYVLIGDIGLAIIVMTIIIRVLLIPLFRRQTVSQRRMQLVMPELREIQKRYRGDRQKSMAAQQELYRERGVNPAAGCLPSLLQLALLIPMYSVISSGLTNYDPTAMLSAFGVQVVPLSCPSAPSFDASGTVVPCIDTTVWWLSGLNVGKPEIFIQPFGFAISVLAVVSAILQVVQTRMVLNTNMAAMDQQARLQNQLFLFLPLISVIYGGILPAGLFIYWVTTTIFSIVQQYLIVGWGGLFPLFGWNPAFARNHTPRFPVEMPTLRLSEPAGRPKAAASSPRKPGPASGPGRPGAPSRVGDRAVGAERTIRPRERGGRQGRRGRRR